MTDRSIFIAASFRPLNREGEGTFATEDAADTGHTYVDYPVLFPFIHQPHECRFDMELTGTMEVR